MSGIASNFFINSFNIDLLKYAKWIYLLLSSSSEIFAIRRRISVAVVKFPIKILRFSKIYFEKVTNVSFIFIFWAYFSSFSFEKISDKRQTSFKYCSERVMLLDNKSENNFSISFSVTSFKCDKFTSCEGSEKLISLFSVVKFSFSSFGRYPNQ